MRRGKKHRKENQKDLRIVRVVTASRVGLVWDFTSGLDFGPSPTPDHISPVRGWILEDSNEEALVLAHALVHQTLHSEIRRPR